MAPATRKRIWSTRSLPARVIRNARAGRWPRLPQNPGVKDPAHEAAALAAFDFRDALEALLDGHGCGEGFCYTCYGVEGMLVGVGFAIDNLDGSLGISDAVSARRFPEPCH